MEPLRGGDPARIAGYRLLRRVGAGGMGVVYLARSTDGSLAALKVIRAAHADDAGFRARFRREVETAGRVADPWVVPLLDADPDAESPWLATAFVPGPSLSEAVQECGPLPHASVRFLGARLAEALDAVHGAGLVHRDVKPGNVLLAVDGPRMIDFGIARTPEDTALTASGMVVGSPGFLSPEQAQGRGREIGPASDVFSLGCLLAYAVTGERPFGAGSAAGVLMRTVHDEPDLDGVPSELLPLLRDCLEKSPEARPTVAEVRRTLDGARPQGRDGTGGGWLPEPVTRLIARRSAAVLALPDVTATEVPGAAPYDDPEPRTDEAPTGSTRRRLLVLGSAAGVLAAGGTAAWWTADRRDPTTAQGAPARLPRLVVALHADLSGGGRTTGRAQENGVRVAVDRFNSRADRGFELALQVHDDAGSATRARQLAQRLTADDRVRAVIGPTTDACAKASLAQYGKARLAMVSVSVGLDDVSASANRVYAATRPPDATLAAPIVAHLVRTDGARRTVLVDDAAEGDFSWEICTRVSEAMRSGQGTTTRRTLAAKDDSADAFRALAETLTGSGADAVVFGGGYARAAKLARALDSAGYTGARLATQRALDPRFLTLAGPAAEGWVFATAFLDPTRVTAAKPFVAAYRARFDAAPPWYSAEAYDATLFVARAMTTLGASHAERGAIVDRLRATDYRGITKRLRYTSSSTGYTVDGLYLFEASGGRFRWLGQYQDATA
ncbi:bifunctional serine/threonine-protein kinase/ABC transporter substrate-binding protein [Streptomyces sp. NBC_01275]|uniref:bifunctional serine/threonine-protein kinase/ABC transporter substrate-binding protein n=1 Tax=Streptomyces sp. NBC_01275 TaxID=2903807 RepID=UPI00224D6B6F|nr:bifunctional serine/threonine-protein kinase/ABC transporter substrate-binding protein [Streptomyces sp. NBC_01275]MCX4760256.1 bifunctional serine/threonine-protein kinase/ABC transporter substrate-binding protein [Streptomyces sp. NBC_01275]